VRLRKATVSFVMSVRLSVCPRGTISVKSVYSYIHSYFITIMCDFQLVYFSRHYHNLLRRIFEEIEGLIWPGLCTVIYSYVQLCIFMYSYVYLCTVMYIYVQLCTVQSFVLFRTLSIMQLSKIDIMTGNEDFIATHFNYRNNYNLNVQNSR
jgi:hypothetical protein